MSATISPSNIHKPAPKWFRRFKRIWINTENAAIVLLLAIGYAESSLLILGIKTGTSWLLENLSILLANGEEYVNVEDIPVTYKAQQ
jgi:hypothetical protein